MHGNGHVVVYEMSRCREVQVPLEGFQQQQLHVKQALFGQYQVHGAHAAQAVQGLQLGYPVFPFLKFACNKEQIIPSCRAEQFHAGMRGQRRTYWPREDMTVRPCEAAAPSHRSGP